jgi:hypothetical protein
VTTECFTCPQPANYAAVALQLQKTALDAENCIYPLEAVLRGAVNRPTLINTSTNTFAVLPNTRSVLIPTVATTFTNNSLNSVSGTAPPAGVYEVGIWFNAVASGATTDNSYRQVEIVTRPVGASSGEPDDSFVALVIYESSNGLGMDMGLNSTIVVNGKQNVFFNFVHNNASNINISIGAILWWTRISDLAIPRVVA